MRVHTLQAESFRAASLFAGCVALAVSCCVSARAADDAAARIHIFESSLRPAVSIAGDPEPHWTLQERMAHWKVPAVGIAVVRDGKLAWARGYGVLQAGGKERANTETMFSVGSVSKVGAAAMTLRMVDAGLLDLDRDVNRYLTRWQIPANAFTDLRPVTLRGILSHSAGLTVHGFPDFQPGEALPTVIDTLEGRPPARHEPVRVVFTPGAQFRYSGGGITVEQLVVEEASGMDFPGAARHYVFDPLGMRRSTYENPLPDRYGNIAKAHDAEGRPTALPRGYEAMPEMAASGLWTTPSDYAKLVIALIESYRGGPDRFLRTSTARQMMTEVGRSPAGLGPFLSGIGPTRRFSHGGANDSYRAWMEGHLATGNGVVIFTNGANGEQLYPELRRAVAVAEGWGAALSDHVSISALEIPAGELDEAVGVYEISAPASTLEFRQRSDMPAYHVSRREGNLYLATNERAKGSRLLPQDASHFLVADYGTLSVVEFVRGYGIWK